MAKQLFIRAGDGDDYHPFDDVVDAATYLFEHGTRCPLYKNVPMELSGVGFEGKNYISAYWAEKVAIPLRDIGSDDLFYLNMELDRLEREIENETGA